MINHAQSVSPEIAARHATFPHNYNRGQFQFLSDRFNRLPDSLRRSAESRWLKDEKKDGHKTANLNLLKITQKISPAGLAMASDDAAICAKAQDYEQKIERARQFLITKTFVEQYEKLAEIIGRAGVEAPEIKAGVTYKGAVNRMCAAKWWRAQLRATHKRWVESACVEFGSVRRGRSLYVSIDCLNARRSQRRRNDNALKALVAECVETGESIPLNEAVEASVSNPSHRRHEMMLRMHGMQAWAEAQGHSCSFLTITAPSRMHRCCTRKSHVFDNGKYDSTTPREAQTYLSNVWAKVRSELNRQGVTVYGVRVAEPHHDGTPHWHMIIYGEAGDVLTAEFVYWAYACSEQYGEWIQSDKISTQASSHKDSVRFKTKRLVWQYNESGELIKSPVAYVAKYIAKNLETNGIETLKNERSDEDTRVKLDDAIARVDAWRSCWGIRQFQFFGTHAVTVWRELRRIKDAPESSELLPLWESVHKTETKKADWHLFMIEMDKLESLQVKDGKLVKCGLRIATEAAEHANSYGELTKGNIIGLVLTDSGIFEPTRFKRWVIKQSAKHDAPWSPSNNCTKGCEKKSGGKPPDT